jgi:hypothetical protein
MRDRALRLRTSHKAKIERRTMSPQNKISFGIKITK